jgi:hypothetical protein
MELQVPLSIEYNTEGTVPLDEVIDSLIGTRQLIKEGTQLIPLLIAGSDLERTSISVRSITHESPLRELLVVTIFLTFQDDLVREAPELIEGITGRSVPDGLETLVTALVLIVTFYGIGVIKDLISGKATSGPSKKMLNELIEEVSATTGKTKEEIEKILKERYSKKGRINQLSRSAIKFFTPSKKQNNAPIKFSNKKIDRSTVADTPDSYIFEDANSKEFHKEFKSRKITLFAQDRDRADRGWAGTIDGIVEKRTKMKLVDNVTSDQIWQREEVTGSGVIIYNKSNPENPIEIHLSEIE